MKKLSEAEKLANYEEAVNGLTSEKQFEKVQAVKSGVNLKRFLSKDAPDRLVRRFMHRVTEVMDGSMPPLERGRIFYQLDSYDNALRFLLKAYEEGEEAAAFYIGQIYTRKDNVNEAADWLQKASDYEKDDDKVAQILLAKARISELAGNKKRAKQHLSRARNMGTEHSRCYSGRMKCMDGDCRGAVSEYMRGVDEDGSEIGVDKLMGCMTRPGVSDMFGYEAVRKMLLVQIKRGDMLKYHTLARLDESEGRNDLAAESYLRAAMAGEPRALLYLPLFSIKGGCKKPVLVAAEKLFEKNPQKVFEVIVPILMGLCEFGLFLDYCNRMYLKCHADLAGAAINFGMIMAGDGVSGAFVKGLKKGADYCNDLSLAIYSKMQNGFGADQEFSPDAKKDLSDVN